MLYLTQTRDVSEFPRSGNVHVPLFPTKLDSDGGQMTDYPNSLDYRQKGHVTDVSVSVIVDCSSDCDVLIHCKELLASY